MANSNRITIFDITPEDGGRPPGIAPSPNGSARPAQAHGLLGVDVIEARLPEVGR